MLDCQQREVLAHYGSKKENAFQISVFISIAWSSPVSASLATETAQHERSKTSKPFIFNKTTIQSRSYLRGFSNRCAKTLPPTSPITRMPNEPIHRSQQAALRLQTKELTRKTPLISLGSFEAI